MHCGSGQCSQLKNIFQLTYKGGMRMTGTKETDASNSCFWIGQDQFGIILCKTRFFCILYGLKLELEWHFARTLI